MLAPDTDGVGATETAMRIQDEIWSLALPHEGTLPGIVTVSLGTAGMVPSAEHTPNDLLRQADSALYLDKQVGTSPRAVRVDSPDLGGMRGTHSLFEVVSTAHWVTSARSSSPRSAPSGARRTTTDEIPKRLMAGRMVLVTGGTGGIGRVTGRQASVPWRVRIMFV